MSLALALGCLPFMLTVVFNALTPSASGGAVYVAVVVAVALEPSAGDALAKLALRLLGAGISGALGICILRLAMVVDGDDNKTLTPQKAGCAMGLIALLGFIFEVHKRRFEKQASLWALMLLTLPIVVEPSLRCAEGVPRALPWSPACRPARPAAAPRPAHAPLEIPPACLPACLPAGSWTGTPSRALATAC